MLADDELNIETNPHLGQHFLSNPAKLAQLIRAAGIQPADHVVEAGGGIGTVAGTDAKALASGSGHVTRRRRTDGYERIPG